MKCGDGATRYTHTMQIYRLPAVAHTTACVVLLSLFIIIHHISRICLYNFHEFMNDIVFRKHKRRTNGVTTVRQHPEHFDDRQKDEKEKKKKRKKRANTITAPQSSVYSSTIAKPCECKQNVKVNFCDLRMLCVVTAVAVAVAVADIVCVLVELSILNNSLLVDTHTGKALHLISIKMP